MDSPRRFILGLAILLVAGWASADYLETSRSATLKSAADGDAQILERLERGEYLQLVNEDQENGYYLARSAGNSTDGWIYRSLVRRYPGDPPAVESDSQILADPGFLFTPEKNLAAQRHLRLGKPQAVFERVQEGFVSAQDARLKVPLWVQYELRPQDLDGPADRKGNFHQDKSVPRESRASDADYVNSGFDRGHMAPADHMDRNDGVMYESFALSNACPQVGDGFNSHIWAYLEAAVKDWVETRGPLTVITGPIFEVVENRVEFETIGEGRVAVPDAFYKIVVDNRNPDKPEALAFRLPNEALPGEEFEDYLTSVDAIEAETGLDFLTALPETVERSLEREVAEQIW